MNYSLTYEDTLKIVEAYKNFNFYKTDHMFGKFKVSTFNYFLCDYEDFVYPLKNELHINAKDVRGVTFVFNEDGTLYKRFLMLKKFFNLNQTPEAQYNLVKDKKIKNVTYKEDGSLIAFMHLPDGTVFAKTQAGFTNEQSVAAMQIFNSDVNIKAFVLDALYLNYTPLFEYVAFDNRIVLKYSNRELRLIGLRNNITDEYICANDFMENDVIQQNIPYIKTKHFKSLDEIVEELKTAENIEGYVVEFEDGEMIKIKSDWYCQLHGLRTVNIFREDYVIEHYLNETLDTVTQELNTIDDSDAFEFIDRVKTSVIKWSNFIEEKVNILVEEYGTIYNKDWPVFAKNCSKREFFVLSKYKIEGMESYKKHKIAYMLKMSYRLMEAKRIIEKWEKR